MSLKYESLPESEMSGEGPEAREVVGRGRPRPYKKISSGFCCSSSGSNVCKLCHSAGLLPFLGIRIRQ